VSLDVDKRMEGNLDPRSAPIMTKAVQMVQREALAESTPEFPGDDAEMDPVLAGSTYGYKRWIPSSLDRRQSTAMSAITNSML
jgi:hypothetical protein